MATTIFDSQFPNACAANATPGSTPLTGDGAIVGTNNGIDQAGSVWDASGGNLRMQSANGHRYFDHQLLWPLSGAAYNSTITIRFRGDNLADPVGGWLSVGLRNRPSPATGNTLTDSGVYVLVSSTQWKVVAAQRTANSFLVYQAAQAWTNFAPGHTYELIVGVSGRFNPALLVTLVDKGTDGLGAGALPTGLTAATAPLTDFWASLAGWWSLAWDNAAGGAPAAKYLFSRVTVATDDTVGTGVVNGQVTLSAVGVPGVIVRLGGSINDDTYTDATGNYSFAGVRPGTYTLVCNHPAYTFSGSGAVTSASNTQTVNFTATQTKKFIPLTDPNLIYHNQGFKQVTGLASSLGSLAFQGLNPGNYVRGSFTGTSLSLVLDMADTETFIQPTFFPRIDYHANNVGDYTTPAVSRGYKQATPAVAATHGFPTTITLATGLASGTYPFEVLVTNALRSGVWFTTGQENLRIVGFLVDTASGTASAQIPRRSGDAIFFGDSITEGRGAFGQLGTGQLGDAEAQYAYVPCVAEALGWEYANLGVSGQRLANASLTYPLAPGISPPLYSVADHRVQWWDRFDATAVRSWAVKPANVVINIGTNDSLFVTPPLDFTAALQGLLTDMRAAFGAATWIFVLTPFGNQYAANLATGFAAYQAATPDVKCKLIPVGENPTPYNKGSVTQRSEDGTHPTYLGNGREGARVSARIAVLQAATGGSGPTPSVGFSPFIRGVQ